MFYFHPYLGKISNLTSIFFRWVVQPPTSHVVFFCSLAFFACLLNKTNVYHGRIQLFLPNRGVWCNIAPPLNQNPSLEHVVSWHILNSTGVVIRILLLLFRCCVSPVLVKNLKENKLNQQFLIT